MCHLLTKLYVLVNVNMTVVCATGFSIGTNSIANVNVMAIAWGILKAIQRNVVHAQQNKHVQRSKYGVGTNVLVSAKRKSPASKKVKFVTQ